MSLAKKVTEQAVYEDVPSHLIIPTYSHFYAGRAWQHGRA